MWGDLSDLSNSIPPILPLLQCTEFFQKSNTSSIQSVTVRMVTLIQPLRDRLSQSIHIDSEQQST
jgi:hypothetical protein